MAIWHVAPFRFAPAFRALGVCEHIWPFSLRDISATLLTPKWAEIFVVQMAGDETSLPQTFFHGLGNPHSWDRLLRDLIGSLRIWFGFLYIHTHHSKFKFLSVFLAF